MNQPVLLVVGNSPAQNEHLGKFLSSSSYDLVSVAGETKSPYKKKNISNLSFVSRVKKQIFFGIQSINSFSFRHAAFTQKRSKFFFVNLFYKSLALFGKVLPDFASAILRFLDSISLKLIKPLDENIKAVFFTGIISSRAELHYYFSAIKSEVPLIYCPYNWDNPSSKLYVPSFGFTHSLPWGKQMKELFDKRGNDFGINKVSFPFRLGYLKNIKEERKLAKPRSKILVALSQKGTNSIESFITQMQKALVDLPHLEVVIRPHPQNSLKKDFIELCKSFSPKIILDQAYIDVFERRGHGIIPMTDENFRQDKDRSLADSLLDCSLVICEAGTLCLEAGFLEIPVIGLMDNSKQNTAKVFGHFDHFSELSNFLWFKPIFSTKHLSNLVPGFLQSFESDYNKNFEDVSDIITGSELSMKELLEFIGINQ